MIFRDGVSDGVMEKVMRTEVGVLEKTFGEMQDYCPKVTYIVCSKGHGVRFYPTRTGCRHDIELCVRSALRVSYCAMIRC